MEEGIMTEDEQLDKKWMIEIPTQTRLQDTDEKLAPSTHNYICIGSKQITIRKVYKNYYVCSRNWKPKNYKIKIRNGWYTLAKEETIEEAKRKMLNWANEIIDEAKKENYWNIKGEMWPAGGFGELYLPD